MSRKKAREYVMKQVFAMDISGELTSENVKILQEENMVKGQEEYIKNILKMMIENLDKIDAMIKKYSTWDFDRMSKVDIAILRVAITEILYTNIPDSVSASEAVELAKVYGTENSYRYINGILSSLIK